MRGEMYSRLATAPFVSPSATRWRGDDDGGDHIEQFLAEDGSRAKATAKPGTPRSDHADREKPYAGSDRIGSSAFPALFRPVLEVAQSR